MVEAAAYETCLSSSDAFERAGMVSLLLCRGFIYIYTHGACARSLCYVCVCVTTYIDKFIYLALIHSVSLEINKN